jgi:hypothetical protein
LKFENQTPEEHDIKANGFEILILGLDIVRFAYFGNMQNTKV